MTDFRPISAHPGYSVSIQGVVMAPQRHGKTTKLGKPRILPAAELKHCGRGRGYVVIGKAFVSWVKLVRDTWGCEPEGERPVYYRKRPASSYPDGRVITVAEWIEELRSRKST